MNYPMTLDVDLLNYNLEDVVSRDKQLPGAFGILGVLDPSV